MEPFRIDSDALLQDLDSLHVSSPGIHTPRFSTGNGHRGRRDPWSLGGEPRSGSLASDLSTWTDGVDGISGHSRFHEYHMSYPRLSESSVPAAGISEFNIYTQPVLPDGDQMDLRNFLPRRQLAWHDDVFGALGSAYLSGLLVDSPRETVTGSLNARRPTRMDMSLSGSSVMLRLRNASFHDLRGHMRNLAKSPTGHRILLEKMVAMSTEEVEIVLRDLVQDIGELMVDPFASTVIQKLVDVCCNLKRAGILATVSGDSQHLIRICLDEYGSKIIRNLLKGLTLTWAKLEFLSAISPHILQLSKNGNGHQVIEELLKVLPAECNKLLSAPLARNFFDIATDQHGCRVLSEHIKTVKGAMGDLVVAATVAYASTLAQHHYGNYIIQDLLTQQLCGRILADIHRQFQGYYSSLSRNKFASHVVEKCFLSFRDVEFTQIAVELMDDDFPLLLSDEYANYVVQMMTVRSKALGLRIYSILVDKIRASRPLVESSIYGRKALDNLSNKHKIKV
ncbi:hypothetical protein MLD38_012965 [Melastoma candidum]|uniref:Uncharacterized protein n=1 Tax=Melastoma candidum TaxID=119954 RepID=A0ACB9R8N2_9MYRT|nr:hypothetical protein MLD38_012965 [Melastoma candidum]